MTHTREPSSRDPSQTAMPPKSSSVLRRFLAAVAFLTRLPVPARYVFEARDVGGGSLFFPLVGALLGFVAIALLQLWELLTTLAHTGDAADRLPSTLVHLLVAALVTGVGARLTGALHLDAVADMADGFGGGQTREDVLRIMRDHVIGAYGAVALVVLLLIKVAAIAALIERSRATPFLIVAPVLARWATVPLGCFMPYARRDGAGGLGAAVTDHVGWFELVGATFIAALFTFNLIGARGGALCSFVVGIASLWNARLCRRRIGGVTGDTLGANTEICETLVLVAGVLLTS